MLTRWRLGTPPAGRAADATKRRAGDVRRLGDMCRRCQEVGRHVQEMSGGWETRAGDVRRLGDAGQEMSGSCALRVYNGADYCDLMTIIERR